MIKSTNMQTPYKKVFLICSNMIFKLNCQTKNDKYFIVLIHYGDYKKPDYRLRYIIGTLKTQFIHCKFMKMFY